VIDVAVVFPDASAVRHGVAAHTCQSYDRPLLGEATFQLNDSDDAEG